MENTHLPLKLEQTQYTTRQLAVAAALDAEAEEVVVVVEERLGGGTVIGSQNRAVYTNVPRTCERLSGARSCSAATDVLKTYILPLDK